jgi:hypothetical protein
MAAMIQTGTTARYRFWPGGLVATVVAILAGVVMWKVAL